MFEVKKTTHVFQVKHVLEFFSGLRFNKIKS